MKPTSNKRKKTNTHKHYWSYEHAVYQGRDGFNGNEVGVHRYCKCGKHQMAFTDKWRIPPKAYESGN